MKTLKLKSLLTQAGIFAAIAFGVSTSMQASGTLSGTPVTNTATIDYKVNNIPQITATTNAADFVVDNKIDLIVTSTGNRIVTPGSTDQVLVYTITNTGNTTQGYVLDLTASAADDFDMTTAVMYVDNGNGMLDAGDTLYTAGTNAGDIMPDGSLNILVVSETPVTTLDGDAARYDLTATTLDAGTNNLATNDIAVVDDPNLVQNVFADGKGTVDALLDGAYSAAATYIVASAELEVTKSAEVISDPFNSTTNPKAIPGAIVRYTVSIKNQSATIFATDLTTVDVIPANTTYVSNSMVFNRGLPGVLELTDALDIDGADFNFTNADALTLAIDSLSPGEVKTISFDVQID